MRHLRIGRYRIAAEVVAVSVVSAVLLSGVAQCAAPAKPDLLAENSHKASLAAIAARRARDSIFVLHTQAVARTDSVVRSSRAYQGRLTRAIDQSRVALADSSASRDTLQVRLRETLAAAERLSVAFDSTVQAFHVERAAVTAEREAWLSERAANTALIAAKDAELSALRTVKDCLIIGFIPCPNRVQSYLYGVGSVLLLLVVL
jgi:uncharacterized protein YecT (DUF1311 family)